MKKTFAILFISILTTLAWSTAVLAENGASPEPAQPSGRVAGRALLPGDEEGSKINLPKGHFKKQIIPNVIKIILAITGTVSFGVFVYAGVMLIIAQGNEEEITKFKNILIWSAVGLAFIMASYAIVTGVMQLVFK